MESLSLKEENIIKYKRNFFRLKTEQNYTDIRIFFRLEKEIKAIEDRLLRDIKNVFEHKEENYYKPVRVNNFWSNNYVAYKSNGGRKKTISVEKYLDKMRPYLRDI